MRAPVDFAVECQSPRPLAPWACWNEPTVLTSIQFVAGAMAKQGRAASEGVGEAVGDGRKVKKKSLERQE